MTRHRTTTASTATTAARKAAAGSAEQTALFGDAAPIATEREPHPARTSTQDLDLVAAIVRASDDPGFLLIERTGRVVKADPATPGVVDSAARHEQDTVHQLLDAGHLRVGGTHHVHHHGHEGPARSILVPKTTRDMVTRWTNLHPIPRHPPTRAAHPGWGKRPVSGVVHVDVVEPGKALVQISGAGSGGTIVRDRSHEFGTGGYYVETDNGHVLGAVSSFRAGAQKLARHYGYRPGPIEIEHEHRTNPPF